MELSSSLQKDILKTGVGSILNRFKLTSRRDTLFFEDIVAAYVKECDNGGHGKEMIEAAQQSFAITIHSLVPGAMKKAPVASLNVFARSIWKNLGLLDDMHVSMDRDTVCIDTKNECVTRIIGPNNYAIGGFTGMLNVLFEVQADLVSAEQTLESSSYVFRLTDEPFGPVHAKDRRSYDKLNRMEHVDGFTLKNAFRGNVFQLKENKIFFRGKLIWPVESTFFHIIGNRNVLMESVPMLSYDYFRRLLEEDATKERRLTLLKTLIQTMGWGVVNIAVKEGGDISIEIKNPPYGLQTEKDNWDFLQNTILGYLWTIGEGYKVKTADEGYKKLSLTFGR